MNKTIFALTLMTSVLAARCWAEQDASAPGSGAVSARAASIITADAGATQAPDASAVSDEELLKRVAPMASQAAAQVGGRIEARVKAGEVTLSGTVPNEEALQRVAEEVSHVPGIRSVRTDVEIKSADQ
ncbi:BON domain-containing protein [Paludibacterium yongneupense]|uniref:BON domain-containing protein n=1 Tax=Paludibacterium yongneupense TaxID=400061 RepID=UPI00041C7EA1|nr:BON domain-containing protein [Paludibacterium yongneupense]